MDKALIAQIAHEVNRAYCASLGDTSLKAWAEAGDAQQKSIQAGVDMHLANPDTTPEAAHESWLKAKEADGWKFAEKKNVAKKLHPCILPYAELPAEQKAKDYIFRGVVHALAALPDPEPVVGEAATPQAVRPPGYLPVQYVGRRPEWTDRLYGTGLTFVTGQSRDLPAHMAKNLLRHPDLFELGKEDPAAVIVDDTQALLESATKGKKAEDTKQNELQDLYDRVSFMDKAALLEFAKINYRQELSNRKAEATLRLEVKGLIDQYGAV